MAPKKPLRRRSPIKPPRRAPNPTPSVRTGPKGSGAQARDLKRLTHELQTHQIELEQQNEELREAQERLTKAHARYQNLFEFAPMGYFILDGKGRIMDANFAGATMLGTSRQRLKNRILEHLVEPGMRSVYRTFLRQAYESESKATCELAILKENKCRTLVALHGSSSSSKQELGQYVLIAMSDVTEHKASVAALEKSEEQINLFIETIKDYAIFMLDPQGYVTSWNGGAERIKGYQESEILGRHFSCFYLGVDVARGKPGRLLDQARTTGRVLDQGWRVRKDGTRFWADVVITAMRDQTGELRGFSKVVRDISERKQIEENLRETNDRLQALLEHSPSMIFLKSAAGRYLMVNKQFENVFQLERTHVVGKMDTDIFPAEKAREYRQHDQKVLQASRPMEFEESWLEGDGIHNGIVLRFPLFDAQGSVISICGIATDITERMRATTALAQNERRTRLILDNAYDAFVAMDEHGVIIDWNAQAEKMFGWHVDEAMGKMMVELIIPPQHREAHRRGIRRFLETGEGSMLNQRLQLTALRRDGTEFPMELSISPVKVAGTYTFNAFIADITERIRWVDDFKRSHEQLLDVAAHLESIREEERTRMAHEIHDELGQSLTGLKLDLAWVKQQITTEGRPALVAKLDDMATLADDTIQAVRNIATELRPVILDQLGLLPALEWYVREFQSRTGISCHLSLLLRQVSLDGERSTAVFRIFQEVLTNIARHANASKVEITARESAGRLLFEIVDNGRGVTAAELTNPKSFGILGMRHRAALLKGKLDITGTPGRGTKISVAVPLEAGDDTLSLDTSQTVKVKRQQSADKT